MTKEIKETDIQKSICDWLATRDNLFFWRSNNIPAPHRAMPKYSAKGLCDICVVKDGKFIAIEVKRPDGFYKDRNRKSFQSEEQKDFEQKILRHGGKYYVVKSLDEVILIVS